MWACTACHRANGEINAEVAMSSPDFRFKPAITNTFEIAPSHVVDVKGDYTTFDMDPWGVNEDAQDIMQCHFEEIQEENYVAAEMALADLPFEQRGLEISHEEAYQPTVSAAMHACPRNAGVSPCKEGESPRTKAEAGRRALWSAKIEKKRAAFTKDFLKMKK